MKKQNFWLSMFMISEIATQVYEKIYLSTFYENLFSGCPVITWQQTNGDVTYFVFSNFLLEIHLEEVLTEPYVSQECPMTVTVLCKCNTMVGECCYIICDKFGVNPLT